MSEAHRPRTRHLWLLGRAFLVLVGSVPAEALASRLTVEVSEGTLSVQAVDVPLADVLVAVGQRARARILIESILEGQVGTERVTASFAQLAMDDGLRRLLRGRNFILGLGPIGVDEIRVYVDGKTGFRELAAVDRKPAEPAQPSKLSGGPPQPKREVREPAPEDPKRLALLRREVLSSRDATARLEALEELAETRDTRYLLDAVIEALGRERDAKVLEGLLDIAQERGPIQTGPLRALATSDRSSAARAQALEVLADAAGADQSTRALLQTLSRNDPSERVRDTARTLLESLQAPRPLRRPEQFPAKVTQGVSAPAGEERDGDHPV